MQIMHLTFSNGCKIVNLRLKFTFNSEKELAEDPFNYFYLSYINYFPFSSHHKLLHNKLKINLRKHHVCVFSFLKKILS